jgi:hypothetical protein
VLLIAGLMAVGLLALSGAYGFHGDEMYYIVAGQHPALGYVDQGPLTPLLSAASVALLGVSPTAVRLLPTLEMAIVVVLVALLARDLGGSRRAQILAAVTAALSVYMASAHLDTTTFARLGSTPGPRPSPVGTGLLRPRHRRLTPPLRACAAGSRL